jgi:hypothetical protein
MRTINLLAFVAMISGGCVVVHDNGGGGGAGGGGGGGPSGPPLFRIDPGFSTTVSPGTQQGYGITANTGGNYRAVWTGDVAVSGAYSHFTGTVYTPGHFLFFDPGCGGVCPDETNDVFVPPGPVAGGGEQFTFDTFATDGLDGVDFQIDLEPVELDLHIDGLSDLQTAASVFFPDTDLNGAISTPTDNPFQLTTN